MEDPNEVLPELKPDIEGTPVEKELSDKEQEEAEQVEEEEEETIEDIEIDGIVYSLLKMMV